MTESKTSQPVQVSALHNNLFTYGLSDPEIAQDLIRSVLPATVIQGLNLSTLTRQSETFVDPELRDSYADLLYECQLISQFPCDPPKADSPVANVYILLEHKSEPESRTPFQLLRYMVRIWEGHTRKGKRLLPIIPIVVYHGEREWVRGRTMQQLLDYPPELEAFTVSFSFPLLDLWRTSEQIGQDAFLQTLLAVLKYGRSAEFSQKLEAIFQLLALDYRKHGQMDHVTVILEYIMSVNPSLDASQVQNTLRNVLPVAFYPGTLAEKFYREGEAIGEVRGEVRGEARGEARGRLKTLQEFADLPVSSDTDLALLSDAEIERKIQDVLAKLKCR